MTCRGQSLVEFAAILPMLLLLLFGIMDFGRAVAYDVALNSAAQEAARYSILNNTGECHWIQGADSTQPTQPEPGTACANVLTDALRVAPQLKATAIAAIDVHYQPVPASDGSAGTQGARVTLRYGFAPVTGLFLGGATLQLSATGLYLQQTNIQ